MSAPDAAKLTARLLARKGAAAPAALGIAAVKAHAGPRARAPSTNGHDGGEERARVTLRLDERRHLRLKLTAAHLQQSLQELLIEALDRYLDQVGPEMLSPNCVCLASRGRGPTPGERD